MKENNYECIEKMELVEMRVKLGDMMSDPNNSRYKKGNYYCSADDILERTWRTQEFKELLQSFKQQGPIWMSKMVVVKMEDLPIEMKQKIVANDVDKYKYVVVEGNTRLACMKHELMKMHLDDEIPVLLARKNGLSDREFLIEIKKLQAMSNILVVKQWEDEAKFLHIYDLYLRSMEQGEKSFHDIVMEITPVSGGKSGEVKKAIFRCKLAEAIALEADELSEDDWGYLEAFEKNEATRKTVGMDKDYKFFWDESEDFEFAVERELINLIPNMIRSAKNAKVNSKSFRDVYSKIVNDNLGNVEAIVDWAKETMQDDSGSGWQIMGAEKDEWEKELHKIISKMRKFPTNEEWAKECMPELKKMHELLDRVIRQVGE